MSRRLSCRITATIKHRRRTIDLTGLWFPVGDHDHGEVHIAGGVDALWAWDAISDNGRALLLAELARVADSLAPQLLESASVVQRCELITWQGRARMLVTLEDGGELAG